MSARVKHIFLKVRHRQPLSPSSSVVAVEGMGLEGDVSYGRRARQVLLIDFETLKEFDLFPGDVRENITTVGLDFGSIARNAQLRVGQSLLELTGDCGPCSQLEDLRQGLQEAIDGRRGLLAKVLKGGTIRVGDTVRVETPIEQPNSSPIAS